MQFRKLNVIITLLLVFAVVPSLGHGLAIKVIDAGVSGHGMVINAKNHLISLGHTLTTGGTLANYSAFAQVWDLRYSGNLGAADVTAMGSYLAGGGRMYLTGENTGFNGSRNNSLISWISSVGAGTVTNMGGTSGLQSVTAAGQVVNSPNFFTQVAYSAALNTGVAASQGFHVTEISSGRGSLIGWNFGDISGASGARMLVGFDIEIFQNGANWTENMATYLATPVPEPGSLLVLGFGLAVLALVRRQT